LRHCGPTDRRNAPAVGRLGEAIQLLIDTDCFVAEPVPGRRKASIRVLLAMTPNQTHFLIEDGAV
jgi:hypothetical protein